MPFEGNFLDVFDEVCVQDGEALTELVVEKLYRKIGIRDVLTLVTPVRSGQNAPTMIYEPNYNAIEYVDGQSCEIEPCDFSPEWQNKKWELALAECRVEVCTREFHEKYLQMWNMHKRLHPLDDEYMFLLDKISDMLSDILANSLFAKVWLSDKLLTENTINGLDGIIAQVKTLGAGHVVDVAQDDLLDGEEWYQAIMASLNVYEQSDFNETIDGVAIYIDTQDAMNLAGWLNKMGHQSPYNCECFNPDGITQSPRFRYDGLRIDGKPIIPIPYRSMARKFNELNDDGDVIDPNLLLITPQTNLMLGSTDEEDLNMLDLIEDRVGRKFLYDIGYQFGILVRTDHLVHGFGE